LKKVNEPKHDWGKWKDICTGDYCSGTRNIGIVTYQERVCKATGEKQLRNEVTKI
jgi:hypothetical protein